MSPSTHQVGHTDIARRWGDRLPALFGRETRYVAVTYLQQIFLFATIIEAVVLSLDVATHIDSLFGSNDTAFGFDGISRIAYYAFLRGAYVLESVLPIGTFVGILAAEFSLSRRNERIMIFNSGRPPLYSLFAALLVGVLMGGMQFFAESYARPISVELQSLSDFRDYGPRFRTTEVTDRKWVTAGTTIVNGRVDFHEGIAMRDVVIYRVNDAGQLEALFIAQRAVPRTSGRIWTITDGTRWNFTTNEAGLRVKATRDGQPFSALDIPLRLQPLWLTNIEIRPSFVRHGDLAILAANSDTVPNSYRYATAYKTRGAAVARMVGFALLAASLSLFYIATRQKLILALKIGIIGYSALVLSVVFRHLGEAGIVSPQIAAWALPALLIATTTSIVVLLAGRGNGAALRLQH